MSELVVGGLSWLGTHYGGLRAGRTSRALNRRSWPKPWGGLAGLAAMSELVVGGLSWLGTHYGGLLGERTLGAQAQAWAEALGWACWVGSHVGTGGGWAQLAWHSLRRAAGWAHQQGAQPQVMAQALGWACWFGSHVGTGGGWAQLAWHSLRRPAG